MADSQPASIASQNGHLYDPESGELIASCPKCEVLEDQLAGVETENRGWRLRYANLKRDKEVDARKDPLWQEAKEVFDYWRQECDHPRARFDAARFNEVRPFLEKDGPELCRRAIRGYAYDPFVTKRRNGQPRVHNSWQLIFRDRQHFEDGIERVPESPEPTKLMKLANTLLARIPEDDRSTGDRIHEAVWQAQMQLRGLG